jgi:HlyD family secretion protein
VTQAALESARAQVKQKDAALKQAQVDLDHTTILAPVDGVVVSRQVDVGQTVARACRPRCSSPSRKTSRRCR